MESHDPEGIHASIRVTAHPLKLDMVFQVKLGKTSVRTLYLFTFSPEINIGRNSSYAPVYFVYPCFRIVQFRIAVSF
jgi:hypothetical protein